LGRADFEEMWRRWLGAHGQPESLIVRRKDPPKPRPKESDLGDYSFDRAVICDRARTVDLLLANNFHFENNCAVLSVEGYPQQAFDTVRSMLKRNPRLQVYALHDCTPDGCSLAWRLANDPAWFHGHAAVVDVGLRPHHAPPFVGLYLEAAGSQPTEGQGLGAGDVVWLQHYSLELAAVRPEQLLRRLFRAINVRRADSRPADLVDSVDAPRRRSAGGNGGSTTSGDSSFSEDRDSLGQDAADADETTDSFG
jgi:hypothetical protein